MSDLFQEVGRMRESTEPRGDQMRLHTTCEGKSRLSVQK